MSRIHVRMRVGGEQYALAVDQVLEVSEAGDVTPVPGAPAAVLGVQNLRGQIIPVLDLAGLMGVDGGQVGERVVVAEDGGRRAGLVVDAVTDVGPLPEASEETDSPGVAGAVMLDGALVGIVDLPRVLDSVGSAP